jgi:hypothetical protein
LLTLSIPKAEMEPIESALAFLSREQGKDVSQVLRELIMRSAKARGWKMEPKEQGHAVVV